MDPKFERTVLVRNKLDKYYSDLSCDNVNKWVDGFGDLPDTLVRFSLTLPFWQDGMPCPKGFVELREDMDRKDVNVMQSRGLSAKYMQTIGFNNFAGFMEKKIESMFANAMGPVLTSLRALHDASGKREKDLMTELNDTDPYRILGTTRDCGSSFATSLTHVMEGVLRLTQGRMSLEAELKEFHTFHKGLNSGHFHMLPSEDFSSLDDYLDFLRNEIHVGAYEVEVNGGAQFRRLMTEVEIFLRFSEIGGATSTRDVIQARGVSMSSLTWRDVIVKLLKNEAHTPLTRRVQYVGERIKWFFCKQKEAVIEFMDHLEGTPSASMFSPLYSKHVKLIKSNSMIKHLIFQTYYRACDRQLRSFVELFENMLTSTFSNPWVFLKGAAASGQDADGAVPMSSFEETKARIPDEIHGRSGVESSLSKWLVDIPTDAQKIDEAVEKVQLLVMKTYSFIRSQVCDQVELFAESFFKLPMMRRLEEDMSQIELSEEDKINYQMRRDRLVGEVDHCKRSLV